MTTPHWPRATRIKYTCTYDGGILQHFRIEAPCISEISLVRLNLCEQRHCPKYDRNYLFIGGKGGFPVDALMLFLLIDFIWANTNPINRMYPKTSFSFRLNLVLISLSIFKLITFSWNYHISRGKEKALHESLRGFLANSRMKTNWFLHSLVKILFTDWYVSYDQLFPPNKTTELWSAVCSKVPDILNRLDLNHVSS